MTNQKQEETNHCLSCDIEYTPGRTGKMHTHCPECGDELRGGTYGTSPLDRLKLYQRVDLIAAAPEMLAALKTLRDNFDHPPKAYEVILAAIAKAEGKE